MSRIWKWTELLLLTPKTKLKRSEGVKEKRYKEWLPAKNQTNSARVEKTIVFRLNKQNPFKWSFEALKYDTGLRTPRAIINHSAAFKTLQFFSATSRYLLKWFRGNITLFFVYNII